MQHRAFRVGGPRRNQWVAWHDGQRLFSVSAARDDAQRLAEKGLEVYTNGSLKNSSGIPKKSLRIPLDF